MLPAAGRILRHTPVPTVSMSDLPNPLNTLQTFAAAGASHRYYSVPALE